jgi:hypothetical protein
MGIDAEKLSSTAALDAIAEFSRFYLERREQEINERKRQKLRDDFTSRLEMTLVGLQGKLRREIKARARYAFDTEPGYDNVLTIVPSKGEVIDPPSLDSARKPASQRRLRASGRVAKRRSGALAGNGKLEASHDTVHLSILIAFLMLMGGKGLLVRRRSG